MGALPTLAWSFIFLLLKDFQLTLFSLIPN